jgi:ABC-type branched-subunit amino acid transport system substrate-binding protein
MFTFRLPAAADPDKTYTDRNAQLFKKLGATKIALIGGGNQSSASFIDRVAKTVEKTDGLSLAYKVTDVVSGQQDFTAAVQRIKESGADGLLTGMDFLQNTALSDQLARAGIQMKAIVFPGGYDPRVTGLPGIEGAIFGLEFKPFELKPPAFLEFDKWLPKDKVRNQVTYIGWLSAELFLQGIKEAGVACPTRKAFITNLRLLKDYTANGAFDPIDFISGFGKEFRCAYYVKVQNKQFVPQFDGKEFCGKPVTF